MYLVTAVECKPCGESIISSKLFTTRLKANRYLSDLFLKYESIYANEEEDIAGNFNCSFMSFTNPDGKEEYVWPYDERATDGWIDNANCCVTLQLREINIEEE